MSQPSCARAIDVQTARRCVRETRSGTEGKRSADHARLSVKLTVCPETLTGLGEKRSERLSGHEEQVKWTAFHEQA